MIYKRTLTSSEIRYTYKTFAIIKKRLSKTYRVYESGRLVGNVASLESAKDFVYELDSK